MKISEMKNAEIDQVSGGFYDLLGYGLRKFLELFRRSGDRA